MSFQIVPCLILVCLITFILHNKVEIQPKVALSIK